MGKKAVIVGLGCIAAIGLLAIGAGAAFYFYWTSPTYSLRQVRHAVDHRDVAAFEKYVDIHGICDSGVDRFLSEASKPAAGAARWKNALGAGILMVMKPAMVDAMQKEIRTAIADGHVVVDGKSRVEIRIDEVVRDSHGALVWLVLPGRSFDPPRKQDAQVQVRLRDMGTYWQAFEIVKLQGFEGGEDGETRDN
jgi:hypothetical protein